jgi:DnaJ-class molecular chaperone
MTTYTQIKTRCNRCLGTGVDDNGLSPAACTACGGDGYKDIDKLDVTDIMDAISDVMDKCNDIKEVVDEIKVKVDEL